MERIELDEFKSPSRWPWLVIGVVLAIAAVVCIRYRLVHKGELPPIRSAQEKVAEIQTNSVAPAAVGSATGVVSYATLVSEARKSQGQGRAVEALGKYRRVIKGNPDPAARAEAEVQIGKINIELAFMPVPAPFKVEYVVKKGDLVDKIAAKFGTTAELICRSNQIADPTRIKAGDRLRVFAGKLQVTVSKSQNTLVVHHEGEFFKKYSVGTGKFDKTPTGNFTIPEKIMQPDWWRPDGRRVPFTGDPKGENILGTRWMTLRAVAGTADLRGYGIHGTWDDASIGKSESAGCIRLHNADVEELYALLPVGTPVTIVP